MGATNHGVQEITYEYFENATAKDFNKRHLDIQPRGIYKGGYFKKVSNSEITLSIFTAEIGDNDEQISVKTTGLATITTASLDSGNLDSGTPYIVLRWGFLEQQNNYVEIHAVASVALAQANDILVGKVVFDGATITGFDYTSRTFLYVQDLFFKIETSSGLYVQLRAGKIHDGSQYIIVPEQKVGPFSVPGSPNSRIDLVYINTDGTVTIKEGAAGVSPVAPDYENRSVVAEVRIVNEDTSIPANRITDVRSFLASRSVAGGDYIKVSDQVASGVAPQANTSNQWTKKRINTRNHDDGSHCSISSSQITLAAGTYRCRITSPVARNCRQHKARLRNVTSNVTVLVGTSELQHDDYSRETGRSEIAGQFTILSTTVFEIQHYKKGGSYWGYAASVGEVEVYTVAEFWKVA